MPKKATTDVQADILKDMLSAEELDQLHISLSHLHGIVSEGDVDVVIDQDGKSAQQKERFIRHLIDELPSPQLRCGLRQALAAEGLDFFLKRNFTDWIQTLEKKAEGVTVIRMQVAIDFKPADIREMIDILSKKIGKPIALDLQVDRSLIGGVIIQQGNYLSDYSIKSRLDQFRSTWKKAAASSR